VNTLTPKRFYKRLDIEGRTVTCPPFIFGPFDR